MCLGLRFLSCDVGGRKKKKNLRGNGSMVSKVLDATLVVPSVILTAALSGRPP